MTELDERAPGIVSALDSVLYTDRSDRTLRKGLLSGRTLIGEAIENGIEPPEEAIPGVVLAGKVHQLFCGPGKGKTFVALWVALQHIRRRKRVLYLDKENGHRIIAERLEAMGAKPEELDQYFYYVPFPSLDLEPDAVQDYVDSLDGFSLERQARQAHLPGGRGRTQIRNVNGQSRR